MEIEEAIKLITDAAAPVTETMTVPLFDAYGRIAANDMISEEPVPAFDRSAMDGYAVCSGEVERASEDMPVSLKVSGELSAGDPTDLRYTPGSAVRVMTGAMIPEGYDTVVKQEDTDYGEDEVKIYASSVKQRNICLAGEEIAPDSCVIKSGQRIGRAETGLIAALGKDEVCVRRPPRIALISTGSELAEAGQPLRSGQIYNTIRYILGTSLRQQRLEVCLEVTCPDDAGLIEDRLKDALKAADVVITTGGVSVGKKDLIPAVLDSVGAKKLFSRVNIQPGTPTIGSVLDGKVILSLSGNPYAAMANFDLYFWPVISKLMGSDSYLPSESMAVLSDRYDKVNRMRRLVRAYTKDGKVFLPVAEHMSSVFGNTSSCNCYIDIPAGQALSPGDKVRVIRMYSK
ncbi:MAG: molybdopterin molybdotransferase MoeA [Lachnospiraceae bacterium]|nr:molybdopterin molybdotransferase MoeA [Lachnospiraceae bacterium]